MVHWFTACKWDRSEVVVVDENWEISSKTVAWKMLTVANSVQGGLFVLFFLTSWVIDLYIVDTSITIHDGHAKVSIPIVTEMSLYMEWKQANLQPVGQKPDWLLVLWLGHLGDEGGGYPIIVKEEWPQQGRLISEAPLYPTKLYLNTLRDDKRRFQSFCSELWLLWGTLNSLGEIFLEETNS